MTVRDIGHHLASTLGVELPVRDDPQGSPTRCARLSCSGSSARWRSSFPVVYLDAIRVKVRTDHKATSRSAHTGRGR